MKRQFADDESPADEPPRRKRTIVGTDKAPPTKKWIRVREGVYRRSGTNDYYCVVEFPGNAPGKRSQRWFGPFARSLDATDERDRRRREAATGVNFDPRAVSFDEFCDRWIAHIESKSLAPRTLDFYKYIVAHRIKPSFKNVKLAKLSPMLISKAVNGWAHGPRHDKRSGTLSPRSLQAASGVLRMILRQGVKWNLLRHELLLVVESPAVPRRNPSFVAGEDVPKLFTASREAGIYPEVVVCLGLGLRRAELLGLTWGDIDIDASTVRVERGLQRINGKLVRTIPKTATSRRVLHTPEFVINALREVRTALAARRLGTGLGRIPDDHLVFCRPNGEPLDPDNFSKRFSYMARAAGLDIHLHSLRHSAAVIGLQAGVDLKTISSTLGHASIRLTADTYSHVVASVKRDAADRVNAYIADQIAASE